MDMIALRKAMKARKPDFLRQDAHKVKRLPKKWRRPKGIHSKMRHKFKGYRSLVSKGYKSPAAVRSLSRNGMEMVTVSSLEELLRLDAKKQAVIIAKSVGIKKKIVLVEKANELGIAVMNVQNQKDYKRLVEEKMKQRKDKASKTEAKPDAQPAGQEKNAGQLKDDEKKAQEKKELDKVLTKPEK